MKPTMCSFNTGVYVADMDRWKSQNITKKLLYWMNLNTKYAGNIYTLLLKTAYSMTSIRHEPAVFRGKKSNYSPANDIFQVKVN